MGLKEKAVLASIGPAMNLVEKWTKDIKSQNEIAGFIEGNVGILFELPAGQGEEFGGIAPLLVKLMMAEANDHPQFVTVKLLKFYEAFRLFYRDYESKDRI